MYCNRCLSVVHNNYNTACYRDIAVAAAYSSCHGLCSQETFVFVVHVLRCRCNEVDVAFLLACRCFQVAENVYSTLVAINTYSDARCDGIRFLSQAHCQARALGQEVAFVGSSCLDGARDDIAADLHIGLVSCDVQADRCSYLVFLAVSFIVAALCVLVTCGIAFVNTFVCLVADTRFSVFSLRSRRLHTHALHDIGGKARARIGLVVFIVAVLIQRLVDLLIGLGRLFFLLVAIAAFFAVFLLSEILAGEKLVGGIFGSLCSLCELIQIPIDIGTHCRGQRLAVITVERFRTEACLAGCLQAAAHDCLHVRIGDIDRHACTDSRRFAGCKGAALGNSLAVLTRGQVEAHMLGLRIFFIDSDRIRTGDLDGRSLACLCNDIITDDGDSYGCIKRNILLRLCRFVRSCGTCQRIRACYTGRLRVMYRYSADVYSTGFHIAVFTDACLHIQTAVCHGKTCADTDRLSASRLVIFFACLICSCTGTGSGSGSFAALL